MNIPWRTAAVTLLAVILFGGVVRAEPVVQLAFSGVVLQKTASGAVETMSLRGLTLHSGQRVRLTVDARNVGTSAALGFEPSAPIPSGTTLVPGSATATDGAPQFSADGTHWTATATPQTRAIRWIVKRPVAPRATVRFNYEVIVN